MQANLINLDTDVQVLGLPLNLAPLGHVVSNLAPTVTQEVSFTRSDAQTAPSRTFGPSLAPDVAAIENQIRLQVASSLTTAASAINNGKPVCTNPIGCLLDLAFKAVTQLLNSIVAALQTATVDVQKATGLDGTATQGLIHDVIGLDVAKANLDLIYAGCPSSPRLAQ